MRIKRTGKGFSTNFMSLAVALATVACGTQDSVQTVLHHDAQKPTNGDPGYKYMEINDELLEALVMPMYRSSLKSNIVELEPKDSPVYKRLQSWLDAFDSRLRELYPQKMKSIPSPRLELIITDTPNAFVMPVQVCYDIPVELEKSASSGIGSGSTSLLGGLFNREVSHLLLSASGEVDLPYLGPACAMAPFEKDDLSPFLSFFGTFVKDFNANGLPCQLELKIKDDGKLAISVGEKCATSDRIAGVSGAKNLIIPATANVISVFSGLLNIMSEQEVVAVLAHELGHYYKVHVDHPDDNFYHYFYRLAERNFPEKPALEEDLSELGAQVVNLRLPTEAYVQAPKADIRSEVFQPMLRVAMDLARRECEDPRLPSCVEPCSQAVQMVSRQDFKRATNGFPFRPLTEVGAAAYKSLEPKLLKCIEGVTIEEEADQVTTPRQLSILVFQRALVADRLIVPMLKDLKIEKSLKNSFALAISTIDNNTRLMKKPLDQAREMRMGYYTMEQEADELSVEWLAMVGLDPRAAATSQLQLAGFIELVRESFGFPVEYDENDMSFADCVQLFKKGFRDEQGNFVKVPLGDYRDPHHSSCFRAYNAYREIDAHKFIPSQDPVEMTLASPMEWAEIQEYLLKKILSETEQESDQEVSDEAKLGDEGSEAAMAGTEVDKEGAPFHQGFYRIDSEFELDSWSPFHGYHQGCAHMNVGTGINMLADLNQLLETSRVVALD